MSEIREWEIREWDMWVSEWDSRVSEIREWVMGLYYKFWFCLHDVHILFFSWSVYLKYIVVEASISWK